MTTYQTKNCRTNMCDTCEMEIETCPSIFDDVKYGEGTGLDNVIECPNYKGPFGFTQEVIISEV